MNMKYRNIYKKISITALAIAMAIASGSLHTMEVSAGSSDIVINNESTTDSLNASVWNIPSGDLVIEQGKILFPESSTVDSRVIAVNKIKANGYYDELFNMNCNFVLKKISDGQRFVIGLALDAADSYCEEADSIEIYFENKGGLKVGVRSYDENGKAQDLVAAQSCGASLGKNINVSINASSEMQLKIQVNGKTIYNAVSPVDLEGRIGFLQTGSVEAVVNTVEVVAHKYDRPENANTIEDFESGSIDENRFYSGLQSSRYAHCGASVEEIDGNKVFLFKNAGSAFLSTVHDFSNFECTFDVPYMQNVDVVDEDGKVTQPKTSAFVLAIGGIPCRKAHYAYHDSADAIVIEADKAYTLQSGQKVYFDANKYYVVEENKGPSVRLSVIDKVITLSFKLLNSDQYEEIMSYQLGDYTPLGQVQFWSNAWTTVAIDNLVITNKDQDPNVLELEKVPFVMQGTEDWVYEPMEVVYKEVDDTTTGLGWNALLIAAGASAVVIIATCSIVAVLSKKRREANKHEA